MLLQCIYLEREVQEKAEEKRPPCRRDANPERTVLLSTTAHQRNTAEVTPQPALLSLAQRAMLPKGPSTQKIIYLPGDV